MQSGHQREMTAALKRLRRFRGVLGSRQYTTIKGQIIASDIRGAEKGLRSLLPASFIKEVEPVEVYRKHK